MIQSKGIILSRDGVSEYKDALINVYINSSSKFEPTIGVAQVGKIIIDGQRQSFIAIAQIATYSYSNENPSFEQVQNTVLQGLQLDFPNVEFLILE